MQVAAPGFGDDVDIAVAIDVGANRFVRLLAAMYNVLLPRAAFAVLVLPEEPLQFALGERAAAGEPMLSGEIAGRVLQEFEREREEERYREQLAGLTPREEEILKLLATGESNREIGNRLFISEQTVKNHVASIFRKLQVNDRTKAAILAVKLGLGAEKLK